jgi:UPF0755 protein
MRLFRSFPLIAVALLLASLSGCGGSEALDPDAPLVELSIPRGAAFGEVVDTLTARGLVGSPRLFRTYARLRGDDRRIRAGDYAIHPDARWKEILAVLVEGRVRTVAVTIPEGFTLTQIAPRLAEVTGLSPDSVLAVLQAESADSLFSVPGPGLEGYLFPDTYRFAMGISLQEVLETLTDHYHDVWTEERRDRLDNLDFSEQEVVTLASIIQGEARRTEEMPVISAVYHNRLRRGWLLQADPTIQYALGGRRERLLYSDIDAVADHPYNTYTHPGLPPGPIGAPGEQAIQAALYPDSVDFMFFVARPDGSHVFTRTLAEHNRAKAASRREAEALRRESENPGAP